jgi:hypothetical protein
MKAVSNIFNKPSSKGAISKVKKVKRNYLHPPIGACHVLLGMWFGLVLRKSLFNKGSTLRRRRQPSIFRLSLMQWSLNCPKNQSYKRKIHSLASTREKAISKLSYDEGLKNVKTWGMR